MNATHPRYLVHATEPHSTNPLSASHHLALSLSSHSRAHPQHTQLIALGFPFVPVRSRDSFCCPPWLVVRSITSSASMRPSTGCWTSWEAHGSAHEPLYYCSTEFSIPASTERAAPTIALEQLQAQLCGVSACQRPHCRPSAFVISRFIASVCVHCCNLRQVSHICSFSADALPWLRHPLLDDVFCRVTCGC